LIQDSDLETEMAVKLLHEPGARAYIRPKASTFASGGRLLSIATLQSPNGLDVFK
jgi:hypothetical protein